MILISDPHGLPLRGLAPATAAETVMICPHDKPQAHARSVEFPETWLPLRDPAMPYGARCWWVCDRIFTAAVVQLGLDADFFWCVEGDVVAKPETWQRLIVAGESRALDGIFIHLADRASRSENGWLNHPTTPEWADRHCLGAMYRFSRRAMQWIAESAEENREVFCEVHAPSIIRNRGGSIGDLHQLGWFYNSQCMQAPGHRLGFNSILFNHPHKTNTECPELTP